MPKWSYNETGSVGSKVTTGYYLIEKPFNLVKGFREMPWGLVSAIVTGTVKDVLPYEVGAEGVVADRQWVGEPVSFFLAHPISHYSIEEGVYQYLDQARFKSGGFESNYWLDWLLAKVGFSAKGLEVGDNELLERQILALLNTCEKPFPVCVFKSATGRSRVGMIGKQVPPHTKLLAQFYKFLYFDRDAERPVWLEYEDEGERGVYTKRAVEFLLRVVAPDPWTNTVAHVGANYTIFRGEEGWAKTSDAAAFIPWCSTLGVELEEFAEGVSDDIFEEVEVGGYPNLLKPLEEALQYQAEMGRLLKIVVNKSGNIVRSGIQGAASLDITSISEQRDFVPTPLRSIDDIDEGLYDEEPVPGFDDEPSEPETEKLSVAKIMRMVDGWAGFTVWKNRESLTEEGKVWAGKYLVPLFENLGMDRTKPFEGWTEERRAKMAIALDETYKTMVDHPETEKAMITEYLTNLWAGDEADFYGAPF